jgi:hypothetical protein
MQVIVSMLERDEKRKVFPPKLFPALADNEMKAVCLWLLDRTIQVD